jgi:hypothetical protein
MGWLSDYYARQAATAGGVSLAGLEGRALTDALLPFGSAGLHSALYAIPTIGVVLTFVLFAGARTVTADAEALRRWFRETAEANPSHGPFGAPVSKAPVPGAVGAE